MDFLYYLILIVLILVLIIFPVFIIAAFIEPQILNSRIKKPFSKLKIVSSGVGITFLTILILGIGLGITEPASLKQARAAEKKSKAQTVKLQEVKKQETEIKKQGAEAAKPKTKTVIDKQPIPFNAQQQNDDNLPQGQTKIVQNGKNGEQTTVYEMTYVKGAETARKVKSQTVSVKPVAQITSIGTYVAPPPPQPVYTPPASSSYSNCTEARSAGVAPIYRGQPGYASHLDRDNDGIACE